MAGKVIISEPAREDLSTIVAHVAADNPDAALKLGEDLVERAESLALFPLKGMLFGQQRGREIYEIPCRGYRLFYQIHAENGRVEILHVRHGARSEPKF